MNPNAAGTQRLDEKEQRLFNVRLPFKLHELVIVLRLSLTGLIEN